MVQKLKPRTGGTMAPRRYLWTNVGYGVMMGYLDMGAPYSVVFVLTQLLLMFLYP